MLRWLSERRLVLVTGLAAGLPVIVATIDVATSGWTPIADDAVIAVRAYDVFTGDSPLVGQYSQASTLVGQPTHSLGPLLFWLLAIPVRLPWAQAPEVTVGLVNLGCVVGSVGLAHRRGGRPLMFATAIAIPIMLASLPAEAYSDIWNPSAPVLPMLLLLFAAWSIGCGEYRLLPLAVLLASFAAQSHLSFLPPAAGASAVAVAGLALSQRSALLRPPARTWIAAALLVGVVCWTPPAIDQITNSPGNVRLLYQAGRADQAKLGLTPGWRGVVHAVGVVPWWLRDPQFGVERIVEIQTDPDALAIGSTLLILAALVAVGAIAWRRRRHDVAVAAALALVSCAAIAVVIASTPEDSVTTLSYSVRWVAPVGMWVWLALGWSLAVSLGAARLPVARLRRARGLAPLGLAVVVAVGVLTAAAGGLRDESYSQTRALADRVKAGLPADRPVRLVVSAAPDAGFMGLNIQSALLYELHRDGRDVRAPGIPDYAGADSEGAAQILRIDVGTPPPADGRVLARATVTQALDPQAPPTGRPPPRWPAAVTLVPTDPGADAPP